MKGYYNAVNIHSHTCQLARHVSMTMRPVSGDLPHRQSEGDAARPRSILTYLVIVLNCVQTRPDSHITNVSTLSIHATVCGTVYVVTISICCGILYSRGVQPF